MKKGDDFWDDIDSLLDDSGRADNTALCFDRYDRALDRHDRAIAQHIAEEVDRTSVFGLTVVSDSAGNNSVDSKSNQGIRTLTNKLQAWINGGAGGKYALNPVLAFAAACVLVLPVYLLLSAQNPGGSQIVAPLPAAAESFAIDAVEAIDYAKGSYGLIKSQPSDVYKAFVTGVLYTDSQFFELAGEQTPSALYLSFADNLGESGNAAVAEQKFDQAVQGYGAANNSSEHTAIKNSGAAESGNASTDAEPNQAVYTAQWFRAGSALEYVRVTATIAMADYQGDKLIEALDHYAQATSGLTMSGQSQQFLQHHQQLSDKAGLSALSPDDIEAVQEHATSLKILVR